MTDENSSAEGSSREALDHAWRWFELHARQRLQLVNFFLLSGAFLTSAYAVALDAGYPEVSVAVALIGALTAVYFWLIGERVRLLLKAGECAMKQFERRLAANAGTEEIKLVERVERPETRWMKYSTVIRLLHLTLGLGFAVGFFFALAVAFGCA